MRSRCGQAHPTIPTGYCFRAECHVALGQFDSAIADFEKAVSLAPDLVRYPLLATPALLPLLPLLVLADVIPVLALLPLAPVPGLPLWHFAQSLSDSTCS